MTTAPGSGRAPRGSAEPIDASALLRTAVGLHQAGRLAEAEDLYRRILAAQPRHFDSLHLLGVILHQRGEHLAAVEQIDAAIAINPAFAQAHNNRGVSLQALGRHDEALASFARALALAPGYFDAQRNGADTLRHLGRFEEAVGSYDQAISLNGDVADLHVKRGHALLALGRREPAIDGYARGIACDPGNRDAHLNRGIALAGLGRLDEAVASYDAAIAVKPNDAEAFNNRGAALRSLRRLSEALASCDRAIALDPALAAAFNTRGMALRDMNRLEDAVASYDAAIRLAPGLGEVHGNRANALVLLRRFEAAIAGYEAALAANPGDATIRCNLGIMKLLLGRFEDGWKDYEARLDMGEVGYDRRELARPQWTGEADIAGKRLLLLAEQGLGDTIMAVRYVRQLAARGAHVILEVQATLRSLMQSVGDVNQIVVQGDARPDFDLYCPLLSLPGVLKTRLDTIPADVPYLAASPSRVATWRERLARLRGLRVGLVWAGNPQHLNDLRRSVGLPALLPLLSEPDVGFVSLQKDLRPGDAELLGAHPQVIHLGEELASYDDTAAVVSLLDLVISVDTSVAHVTGALGKPIWILLPPNPDWRWLLDRADSPWYPTARLFRQSVQDDWTEVIGRVLAELRGLAGVGASD
jgi:tetratricopeptide (TPR) repeat protein